MGCETMLNPQSKHKHKHAARARESREQMGKIDTRGHSRMSNTLQFASGKINVYIHMKHTIHRLKAGSYFTT